MSDPGPDPGVAGVSEVELEQIFRQQITWELIQPDEAQNADLPVRQERPEVVFVVAQPGAGAAARVTDIQQEFDNRGGTVPIVAERFRPYHPDYAATWGYRPEALADVTDPAAGWWAQRSLEWLAEGRYNVVVNDWSADPDHILGNAGRFADVGYEVRLAVLAVPPAISRLTIIETFARAAEVTGTGPWVDATAHDAGYAATAEVLRRAETSAVVSRITVDMSVGAIQGPAHDVERHVDGAWRNRGPHGTLLNEARRSPLEVLKEARDERFTTLERTVLANRLSATMERLEEVGVAYTKVHDMGADVHRDLASTGFEARVTERLDAALDDLLAANDALDTRGQLEPPNGPDTTAPTDPGPDLGPDPGPDLGPELGP